MKALPLYPSRRTRLHGLASWFAWTLTPILIGATTPADQIGGDNDLVRLNPYTVKAEYPSVQVRFKLSGGNLFEPMDDPVLRAEVSAINDHGGNTRNEIELGDRLIAINGTELAGLSLNQIATVLSEARQAGVPV